MGNSFSETELLGTVSAETDMLFLKENSPLRLIQKGMEICNVSLVVCSILLHFIINALVKRPSSDEVAQNYMSSHSLRRRSICFYLKCTVTWDPITVLENCNITAYN